MLVGLYTKKMLHNGAVELWGKIVSFETTFISLSVTVTIWFLNLERTVGKRWLTWKPRIFSAIEEQGLAFRKQVKKFVFFTLNVFCYLFLYSFFQLEYQNSHFWDVIIEGICIILSSAAYVLVILSSGLVFGVSRFEFSKRE